jgi:hypothetical protein
MAEFLIVPFVEIEVRFGTQNGNKFDSSVDKRYFEKIIEILETGVWNLVECLETTEYIKDSVKLSLPSNKAILKENIITRTHVLKDLPFDIRFSINQEFKFDTLVVSKNDSVVRNKNRRSFINDNFRYDLTIVNEKKNGISILKHEIEIELLVNPETLTWTSEYINDFLECKIYDLVNIVEPIKRESFKIKLN